MAFRLNRTLDRTNFEKIIAKNKNELHSTSKS